MPTSRPVSRYMPTAMMAPAQVDDQDKLRAIVLEMATDLTS
ncbi:MAG: hypothetical protein ACRDOH_32430 [Streptosporangiaceae bacterium]